MAVANQWNENQMYAFHALAIPAQKRPKLLPTEIEATEYGKLNAFHPKITDYAKSKQSPEDT